jgi:hypothetical protein
MEKVSGIKLEKVWDKLRGKQKYEIVKQLINCENSFASTKFRSFGSLYYAQDVPRVAGHEILCVTEAGTEVNCSKFAVGPSNYRKFFEEGRERVVVDRGPCMTSPLGLPHVNALC